MANADFPRWRVARRIGFHASDSTAKTVGIVVMPIAFAFIGAFFTLPARNTWGERFVNGAIAGAIAVVFVLVFFAIWHVGAFYLGKLGWTADKYETGQEGETEFHTFFVLRRDPDVSADLAVRHGKLECRVKTPSGEMHVLTAGSVGRDVETNAIRGLPAGDYETRWYCSRRKSRFYEIARATVTLNR